MRYKYSHQKTTVDLTQTICPNRIALHMDKNGMHSAEFGFMSIVSEISDIEPKHKQTLRKLKNTVHIVTSNHRNLSRTGQLEELTASAAEHNIDVVCVQ